MGHFYIRTRFGKYLHRFCQEKKWEPLREWERKRHGKTFVCPKTKAAPSQIIAAIKHFRIIEFNCHGHCMRSK